MTFTKLSAAAEDAVGSFKKSLEDKGWVDSTGTHHSDGSKIWWVLET